MLQQGLGFGLRRIPCLFGDGAQLGRGAVQAGVELLEQGFGEAHREQRPLDDLRWHRTRSRRDSWLFRPVSILGQQPLQILRELAPLDQVDDPVGPGDAALGRIALDLCL